MRLDYKSSEGHFNMLDTSEVSIVCDIKIYDDANKIILSTNVKVDYRYDGDDIDEAIELIEDYDKRLFFSSDRENRRKVVKYLKDNRKEIEIGSKQFKINKLQKRIEELQKQITSELIDLEDLLQDF